MTILFLAANFIAREDLVEGGSCFLVHVALLGKVLGQLLSEERFRSNMRSSQYEHTSRPSSNGKIIFQCSGSTVLCKWNLHAEHEKVSASKLRLKQDKQMLCEQAVVTGMNTMS